MRTRCNPPRESIPIPIPTPTPMETGNERIALPLRATEAGQVIGSESQRYLFINEKRQRLAQPRVFTDRD